MMDAVKDDVIFMECPFCRHDIAAAWQPLTVITDELGRPQQHHRSELATTIPQKDEKGMPATPLSVRVILNWLRCQNTECCEIVVQATRCEGQKPETWIVVPKRRTIPGLSPLVIDPFRKDYQEACTLLEDSSRMSSVLSRHILADLLKTYAKLENYGLANRIDALSQILGTHLAYAPIFITCGRLRIFRPTPRRTKMTR